MCVTAALETKEIWRNDAQRVLVRIASRKECYAPNGGRPAIIDGPSVSLHGEKQFQRRNTHRENSEVVDEGNATFGAVAAIRVTRRLV